MEKIKVTAISPYEGLKELLILLGKDQKDLDLNVEVGNLQKGVEIAKQAELAGADMIISRGGTTYMIQEEVSIPVIDIEVSGYDILRVLTLAKGYSGKAAIVSFPSIAEGTASICSLLHFDIDIFKVYSEKEVTEKLRQLADQEYQVIISGVEAIEIAEKMGLNGILLTSGKESILKAFNEARKIYRYMSRYKKHTNLYKSIIESTDQGFLLLDEENEVIYHNKEVANYLDCINENVSELKEFSLRINKENNINTLVKYGDRVWKVKGYLLDNNQYEHITMLNFQEVIALQKNNGEAITIKYPLQKSVNPFLGFSTSGAFLHKITEKTRCYYETKLPIWLIGDRGTGKEFLAYLIHRGSEEAKYPFIMIDCERLTHNDMHKLFYENIDDIRVIERDGIATIYFKNINLLSKELQQELYDYLLNKREYEQCRYITSSSKHIQGLVSSGQFCKELYLYLSKLNLFLPPLKERSEDIDMLISLFINENNIKYGKQVSGILSSAANKLKEYGWPGNIDQLKQVIEELVILCKGPYIEELEVEEVLINLNAMNSGDACCNINLNNTIEEIEKEIINKVLIEEGMNQSRAAQRLGINRSTLWRKLK